MKSFISMMVATLLPGMGALAAPAYPFSMADWNRMLEGFTAELATLDAESRLPKAGDVIRTRDATLSKYAQLYARVCDAARRHSDSFIPEPDLPVDYFDVHQRPTRRSVTLRTGPTAICEVSIRDMAEAAARFKRREAEERMATYMEQNGIDSEIHQFRSRVASALGGYSGYAFELDEKDAQDRVISASIADPLIRKRIRELLLLAPYKSDPQPDSAAPKPDPEEQRRKAAREKERWDALAITMSVTSHPRFQQVTLTCTEPYGSGHGLCLVALGTVSGEAELAALKELVISKNASFQVEYHVMINAAFETDPTKIAMARARARYISMQ